MKRIIRAWTKASLIKRILIGMIFGATLGMLFPNLTEIGLLGDLFGISNDLAMQVVGVGFVIGVVQDSCETALNSSTDVLFTAVAEYATNRKLRP